ncbi:MAG: trehalose-phosphatase [Gemmatimonadales bacterium]
MIPLSRAPGLVTRCVESPHPLFLLDLDGTLVPIVERPELALLPAATRRLLVRLRATGARVVVVSGRSIPAVQHILDLPVDAIIGDHGAEALIDGHMRRWLRAPEAPLARASREVVERIDGRHGMWLEAKRHSLAVHLRLPPARRAAVIREMTAVLRSAGLRVLRGHRVLDGQLHGIDKGRAVVRWLDQSPGNRMALYAGDDTTDEDVFRQLRKRHDHAVTVAVGDRPRGAGFRTRSPATLARWLARVVGARERR